MATYLNEYDYSLLPPHVIAQILNNLSYRQIIQASRACKSWHFASSDPMISKRVRVRIRNQLDRLEQLTRPFGALVLSDTNFNQFNYKEFFAKFGQHITDVEFVNCTLSVKQFFECLIFMTNLSTLKIVPCVGATFSELENVLDLDIELAKPILNRIKHFSVLPHSKKCDGLENIMNLMANLKILSFGLDADETNEPCNQLISYMNMFKLEELEVENLSQASISGFIRDFSKITTIHINSLSLNLNYSDILRVRYYDENFVVFCKKLANLKRLSMQSIGENHLVDICRYITQLTELSLFGITTNKIHVIGDLTNLRLFAEAAVLFNSLVNLNDLELDYEITDAVLNAICTNCKNLTRLGLSRMSTNNLDVLFKNLTQLKYLDLSISGCRNDSFELEHDITNLSSLMCLNIDVLVPGVTMELIEKLPKLKNSSLQDLKYKFEGSVKRSPMLLGIQGVRLSNA